MKKKPSKKKSDAEFIAKISTINIGGKSVSPQSLGEIVEKHGPPDKIEVTTTFVRVDKKKHDGSGEQSISA